MSFPIPSRAQIEQTLAAHGLRLRGGWRPLAADAVPALPDGQASAVLWMVGVVGSAFWPFFKASSFFQDGQPHPLDRWSEALGTALARQWGGLALFPFDGPPYHPFQQWAARAEPLQPSPMMLRLHPQHGLWHAYRFALALPAVHPDDLAALSRPLPALATQLCLSCDGQPCLSACPVQAFTGSSYRVEACAAHLHTPEGQDCMQSFCQARLACPVGQAERYLPEHAAFHMRAFLGAH